MTDKSNPEWHALCRTAFGLRKEFGGAGAALREAVRRNPGLAAAARDSHGNSVEPYEAPEPGSAEAVFAAYPEVSQSPVVKAAEALAKKMAEAKR